MPFCKNDPKKKYKGTEPSPKGLGYCAHSEEIGTIRLGRDNKKWIITTTSKGIKRWIIHKNNEQKRWNVYNGETIFHEMKSNKCLLVKYKNSSNSYIGIPTRIGYIRKIVDYNLFEEKETKIRKDYKQVKLNESELNKYCSNKIILKKDNEEYKIIKENMKGYKSYFIHVNDKRPLLVYIKDNNVYIYKISNKYNIMLSDICKDDSKNKWMYTKLVNKYVSEEIFIGKSIKTPIYATFGPDTNGNSILLLLEDSKYLYIGSEIYQFTITPTDKIIKYYSGIGNNDVPYPVALGEKNVYFMLDKRYINIDKFPNNMNNEKWTESYLLYDDLSKYSDKMKNIKITKY
jgi:hypothetical protein